jgi:TonB C terminal
VSQPRSPHAAPRESLGRFLSLSMGFHAALVGLMLMATYLAGHWGPPRYVPHESIEVSMVALPKSRLNVPDRATRVKRASGQRPSEEPPPVQRSDLAFRQDRPDPESGNTDQSTRQEVLNELERERLLQELLNAPEGPQDRDATDPNGVEDLDVAVAGAGSRADPDFMRWYAQVQSLLMGRFKPIGAITQGRDDLSCIVNVILDAETGEIESYEITQESGALAFDKTAERVVAELSSLPLPPERYRPLLRQGIGFRFVTPSP